MAGFVVGAAVKGRPGQQRLLEGVALFYELTRELSFNITIGTSPSCKYLLLFLPGEFLIYVVQLDQCEFDGAVGSAFYGWMRKVVCSFVLRDLQANCN